MNELAELARTVPDGVIRSAELRTVGVSNYAVSARCRPSGPWLRMLPGVVLMGTGPPTRRQRLRAAVAYAGPGSMITGADALRGHGLQVPARGDVLVLVPAGRRVTSRSYLTVERTGRPPEPVWRDGLPLAPVARAAIDAARHERDRGRLRALLLAPVEAGACGVDELSAALGGGRQRGTAAPRALLAELRLPVLVRQLGLDVPHVGAGARGTQPDLTANAVLDDPCERFEGRVERTRPVAPGTSDTGLISHTATLRRT